MSERGQPSRPLCLQLDMPTASWGRPLGPRSERIGLGQLRQPTLCSASCLVSLAGAGLHHEKPPETSTPSLDASTPYGRPFNWRCGESPFSPTRSPAWSPRARELSQPPCHIIAERKLGKNT